MSKALIGKTITDITVDDSKEFITVVCGEEHFVGTTYGDCCSYTWIEHVEYPVSLPATVLSVRELDMPDLGDMEGRDVVQYYGYEIVTDKGSIVIDFRNDSNGYYGGELEWAD